MNINIDNLVSISVANQNFSRVARLVDENAPRYVRLDYNLLHQNAVAGDSDVDAAAARILLKHMKAFEELAK